ncbi:MAG: hypothetical protein DI529_10100 [Chryseobacterium sp.]|nr:MAG: hypothetical protein DI529_10100 [Chryseobacterium sp.]
MNIQQQYTDYYTASGEPEIVEVSKASYISIMGSGSPGTNIFYAKKKAIAAFTEAVSSSLADTDKAFTSNIVDSFVLNKIPESFL